MVNTYLWRKNVRDIPIYSDIVLTIANIRSTQHVGTGDLEHSRSHRSLSREKIRRYWMISVISTVLQGFGFSWMALCYIPNTRSPYPVWYKYFDILENVRHLPLVNAIPAYDSNFQEYISAWNVPLLSTPVLGFVFFCLFALDSVEFSIESPWVEACIRHMKSLNPSNWFKGGTSASRNFDSGFSSDRSENFTPFRVDDILLEPYPLSGTTKPSAVKYSTGQLLIPGAKHLASTGITELKITGANRIPRLPDTTSKLPTYQQGVLSERWRTYKKEPTTIGLLPSSRSYALDRRQFDLRSDTSRMQSERRNLRHPMRIPAQVRPAGRVFENEGATLSSLRGNGTSGILDLV
ncbi:hypothetical protein FRC17_010473 [Serendipita sp. 399]|nr:hypothetical protein FRC17_010473 [Serendipita sp. 399]